MTSDDRRHIHELEERLRLLERGFLLQEKRIWSQTMLGRLERDEFMAGASPAEKERTRRLLQGNLRVAVEMLDRIAEDLGYDRPTVFQLLEPEFVYGAPGTDVGEKLTEQLERVDARERESGTSHLSSMLRDLKTRHDPFLGEVQQQVQRDVDLHTVFGELVSD
ncbi:MAG: hypothetical protein D6731_14105 [Planctomycetota bacterium]|nr:MAG: hypothetical protein D6731_14105 [Planctomycetota bacterium]